MSDLVVLSSTPDIHDHLTGQPGSHAAALAQLATAGEHFVRTDIRRANVRGLAALAQWLTARRDRITRWRLRWIGESQREGLAPTRLGMATPYMLHAATTAIRQGLRADVEGLPTCVLGPHARLRAIDGAQPMASFPSVCGGCTAREHCCGVPTAYAERFAIDLELTPVVSRP